ITRPDKRNLRRTISSEKWFSSANIDCPSIRDTEWTMISRTHKVEQHQSAITGIEAMTLISNHHFPRHSHDQFGIGVVMFGSQRSWSGVGQVDASAGDVIMVNPGEIHDGCPYRGQARGWQMLYLTPSLLAKEVEDEDFGRDYTVRP